MVLDVNELGERRREVGHAAGPDGARRAGVPHVDGAQAAFGMGEVTPGVVSHHEALGGGHAQLSAELLVVAGPRLAPRAVLGTGDEREVALREARPGKACHVTGVGDHGVRGQRAGESHGMDAIDGRPGPGHGLGADDARPHAGHDGPLVAVHHVGDDGVVQGDARLLKDHLVDELGVGEPVAACFRLRGEPGAGIGGHDVDAKSAGGAAEQARGAVHIAREKRREVEAQQRVVKVEEDGANQGAATFPNVRSTCEEGQNTQKRSLKRAYP